MAIVGIDGGGTKTSFALFSDEGVVLNRVVLETIHILQVSEETFCERLTKGFKEVISIVPEQESIKICLGLAGYGQEPSLRSIIERLVNQVLGNYPYLLMNDVEIALSGALNYQDGIVLIAGTGSIGFAKHQDKMKRVGGWGYAIGDEGSAYWIAKKMLAIFAKQADGRLGKTLLYELLMKHLELENDFDIISYVMTTLNQSRDKIAELSMICYEAAKQKDEYAIEIFNEAALELAMMANQLLNEFDEDIVLISMIGGVSKAQDVYLESFKSYLSPRGQFIQPIHNSEMGAFLLAKDKLK